jgi:hypothetical protein
MNSETERLFDLYGDILRARGLADRSITNYQYSLKGFDGFLGSTRTSRVRAHTSVRNPQQSHTTQGPRALQGLASRRPAATSRTARRDASRSLDAYLQSRPGYLPSVRRGHTSLPLRMDSEVGYRRTIRHQPEGAVNVRVRRRGLSGTRIAAQITPHVCVRTGFDRCAGRSSMIEGFRFDRGVPAMAPAPSTGPSAVQNIDPTRQHHFSNTPSRKSRA